jgi:hypothetical protein
MEIWKPVLGYEGLYEVSDQGSVRNKKRRILKDRFKTPMRYRCVALNKNQKATEKKISTLVLESFISPRPHKMVVRHLNGNAQDDRLCNLTWGTQSENIIDKFEHGTNNYNSVFVKLTNINTGEVFIGRQRPLSRELGLKQNAICYACKKQGIVGEYICQYIVTEEE